MKKTVVVLISNLLFILPGFCQQNDANYVKTETMLDSSGANKIISIQYYDGFGRPIQTVSNGINSNTSSTNSVVVEYDDNGREYKKWLPIRGMSLDYNSFITGNAADDRAYSKVTYDALDRPVFISTPGRDMRDASSVQHGKTTEYTTNASGSVKHYVATSTGISAANPSTYPANILDGEKTTDEDGHCIEIFKDFLGNVVLERRYETATTYNDTYYVYDNIGQLRYVLPPMCSDISSTNLSRYAYQYTYDSKGRILTRKLPGCTACQYRYDTAGRMISSKDANNVTRFYLYDGYGRMVVQGRCSAMQENDTPCYAATFSHGTGICRTGYVVIGHEFDGAELETANYYDSYGFLENHVFRRLEQMFPNTDMLQRANTFLTGKIQTTSDEDTLLTVNFYDIRGNVVSMAEAYPHDISIKKTIQYSFTDSPVSITSELFDSCRLANRVQETLSYDENSGKLLVRNIALDNHGAVPVSEYTYDDYGRIYKNYLNDNNIINTNSYNTRGWLTSVSYDEPLRPLLRSHDLIGGGVQFEDNTTIFKENIHYTDGEGTPCYNGNISSMDWKTSIDSTKRCYKYTYDNLDRMTDASYYIGNYSSTDMEYSESLTYNKNSSITSLRRKGKTTLGWGLIDNMNYSYNGNRISNIGESAGRQNYNGVFEFHRHTSYLYNNDGSVKAAQGRGISKFDYDQCGHLVRVQFSNGSVTENVYSSEGQKLRSIHTTAIEGISVTANHTVELSDSQIEMRETLDYVNNFILVNRKLDKYMFDEGYITLSPSDSIPQYHYYVKDHQGNNRMVVTCDSLSNVVTEQVTHYYPYGGIYGDASTGQGVQPYKYNGKEFDRMHGFDMLDYGARFHDPATGNFTSMDPLCEKYYHLNPYLYCAGNPIRFIDKDGMDFNIIRDDEKKTYTIFATYSIGNVAKDEFKKAKDEFEKAKDFWEGLSNKYKTKDNYHIIIRIESAEKNGLNSFSLNVTDLKKEDDCIIAGETDRKHIVIYKNGSSKYTGAHEIGHTLGLYHYGHETQEKAIDYERNNVMFYTSNERGNKIYRSQIRDIINMYADKENKVTEVRFKDKY